MLMAMQSCQGSSLRSRTVHGRCLINILPTSVRAQTRRLLIERIEKGWPRATPSFSRLGGTVRLQSVIIACALVLGVQAQAFGQTSQEGLESLTERDLDRDMLGIISNTVFDAGQEPPRATELASLRQVTPPTHLLGDPT